MKSTQNQYLRFLENMIDEEEEQKKGKLKKADEAQLFFSFVERSGSMGKYQLILVAVLSLAQYLCGGFFLIAPYIFYQDPYLCPDKSPNGLTCHQYVCSLSPEDRLIYVPLASIESISNYFGDFRCQSQKFTLDWFISFMFMGKILGAVLLSFFGDWFGRKNLVLGGSFCSLIGLLLAMLKINLTMVSVGLFITNVGIMPCYYVSFPLLSEQVSEQYRSKLTVVFQVMYSLGVIGNVLWTFLFNNWVSTLLFFYVLPFVFLILGLLFFVVDTPFSLITNNTAQTAFQHLKYISYINQIQQFNIKKQQIQELNKNYKMKLKMESRQKNRKFTILDLFKYKSLRMMTLSIIFLHITISFQFFGPALILDQFQLSIYINGFVIGIAQLFAYIPCYFLINRIERQQLGYICFSTTAISSFFLVFVWKQGQTELESTLLENILLLGLIFIFRFAITVQYIIIFVYLNELFPTQVRVLGIGIFSLSGNVFMVFIPQLADLCIVNRISIMGCFTVLSILSVYVSSILPETLGQTPSDQIQELMFLNRHQNGKQVELKEVFLRGEREGNNRFCQN